MDLMIKPEIRKWSWAIAWLWELKNPWYVTWRAIWSRDAYGQANVWIQDFLVDLVLWNRQCLNLNKAGCAENASWTYHLWHAINQDGLSLFGRRLSMNAFFDNNLLPRPQTFVFSRLPFKALGQALA